jgi:phospholipid/cholesterol/gamma-HCH transport system ATP-binding protein
MTPPTTIKTPKIAIRGLRKRFGGQMVLDGVDLDVPAGEGTVVIGRSGSGKSVLLKCILGLLTPDEGSIAIDGVDILQAPASVRDRAIASIGMLFQNGALFDSLSIWENIAFGPLARREIKRSHARALAEDLLKQVGLDGSIADLYPASLSGGMQKRVGLARAIAGRPDILFFDEPTTGLDPIMGAVIDGLIVDCVARMGSTALAITHDMASAARIGQNAAMLYEGKIIWRGATAALLQSGHPIVDQFTHGRRTGPLAF